MAWRKKIHYNIYLSAGWTFARPFFRRCRHRLCPNWLKILPNNSFLYFLKQFFIFNNEVKLSRKYFETFLTHQHSNFQVAEKVGLKSIKGELDCVIHTSEVLNFLSKLGRPVHLTK